jgi:hypothetical protein
MLAREETPRRIGCIIPTLDLLTDEKTFSEVLDSHSWKIEKSEPFGTDSFLSKVVCSNCGLERTSIISNIEESSKKIALT